jgi:acetylornithine/N-succinyldiaminopimelate aminotransferase
LDKIANEELLNSVTEKGQYIRDKVAAMDIPCVKEIRGRGLMIGIELKDVSNKDVNKHLIENGLLPLTAGHNVLRFLPPLTITYEEIDKGLDIMFATLKEMKG